MKLTVIAAVANNNVIGADNKLIWHLPADLKHFKELTTGNTIIMGRKTFQSIGKPLPKRRTIVISRNPDFDAMGCEVATSLKDAFCLVQDEKEVFVAGGSEIYRQVMQVHHARKMILTRVFANFEGDSFFPDIDADKWELMERNDYDADEKNAYPYAFLTYKRKRA